MANFDEVITTEARLREIKGYPGDLARDKVIDTIDEHAANFISRCPFLFLSTRGADGREDISPKGDPAGFVKILDNKTLVIPDRPGNNRMDSFSNLMVDDQIGLIFLIPGHDDTLRISGRAQIVRDTALGETMAIKGRVPDLLVVVRVEEVSMHCPKCMIRSGLWAPESWPPMQDFPSLAKIVKDHAQKEEMPLEAVEELVKRSARDKLY